MQNDPLYQYIQLQIPRRTRAAMISPLVPLDFTPDPLNRHYDDRRTWLAWREPASTPTRPRDRFGRILVRLGRWVEGRSLSDVPDIVATM